MYDVKRYEWRPVTFFLLIFFSSFHAGDALSQSNSSSLKIIFINNVKGSKIVLNDSAYINPFGEKYTISKLRYYVTNISVQNDHEGIKEQNSYHLIDESKTESQAVTLSIPQGNYSSLQFLLGVDSLHNVSGAQTGDLDPTKDMFWTWNTGYVMAKMEGNSPGSKMVNNKFEFHIGGFSGQYNVLKQVRLNFPQALKIVPGKSYTVSISADINAWWRNPNDIKISEHAVITTPGKLAKDISDNYANMFHIEKIIQ
jgi:hypothetical protein